MIKKYIIDGNNLIWKIPELAKLLKKEPQLTREKLAFKLERYFRNKKCKVSLHFDGFPGVAINTNKIKIFYSNNRKADEEIREEIDREKHPEFICVVSSDDEILQYSRANSCAVIKAEKFLQSLNAERHLDEEEKIQKEIDNDEILKLFLSENDDEI